MNFDGRQIDPYRFYVTEKEAKEICKENDPNRHWIPLLPKFKFERKVIINGDFYWISKIKVNGMFVWCLRTIDSNYISELFIDKEVNAEHKQSGETA